MVITLPHDRANQSVDDHSLMLADLIFLAV
jgi:hypothetical protein